MMTTEFLILVTSYRVMSVVQFLWQAVIWKILATLTADLCT
jgi:hypothetical protein